MWCPKDSRGVQRSEIDTEIDSEIGRCPMVSRGVRRCPVECSIVRSMWCPKDSRGVPWCPVE
eukprot:2071461-Pyramimonas_sp.AAC.1